MLKKLISTLLPAKKATVPADKSTAQTYKIGDTGPAGGIVFYDKGTVSDGWRYLEAAPVENEFTSCWGAGSFIEKSELAAKGTDTAIGSGRINTERIAAGVKETDCAAKRCIKLKINKYTDWFIPSKDELDLIYKNLKKKKLGGFSDENFWSSSLNDKGQVWAMNFGKGSYFDCIAGRPCRARAVRAFQTAAI